MLAEYAMLDAGWVCAMMTAGPNRVELNTPGRVWCVVSGYLSEDGRMAMLVPEEATARDWFWICL